MVVMVLAPLPAMTVMLPGSSSSHSVQERVVMASLSIQTMEGDPAASRLTAFRTP
jgi:hypothetical protein